MVLQESFVRERNQRVQHASLLVHTLMAVARVIVSEKPAQTYPAALSEVERMLALYEAEVHQDFYRPDVQLAVQNRLARKAAADQRRNLLDASLDAKMSALTYTPPT
jgi:hypothetical protein